MPLCGSPEWKSFPVAVRCQVATPAVPMQGWESAQSIQIMGLLKINQFTCLHPTKPRHGARFRVSTKTYPFLSGSNRPSSIRDSIPGFGPSPPAAASSLAMKTTQRSKLSFGLTLASWERSCVVSAT